jgi:adenosylhomocysteine nucleosidase
MCVAGVAGAQAPIAVQGAVDTELGPLIEAVGSPEPVDVQGFRFWEGEIAGARVVVSRTEVGMVHAAMATTILIEKYAPRIIINQGTAGGVNPELSTGDIVLGQKSVPFGAFRTAPRGRGQGIDLDDWEVLPRPLREGDERVRYRAFTADPDLVALARSIPYAHGKVVEGVVGSADQWNREVDKLLWAHEVFGIDSEDMESAAAHQVAHIYRLPFLAVRVLSNSEHHDPEFRPEVGDDCAEFVVALVRALTGEP